MTSYKMRKRHLTAILELILFSYLQQCYGVIQLRGQGASFPYSVYENWVQSYRIYRRSHADVNATYKAVGSGSGKALIVSRDPSVEYAGSDSLLSPSDIQTQPDLTMFPTMAGGTVMGYNMPECEGGNYKLNLTREHLVGIYNGTFRLWNDSSIAAVNPGCTMPDANIKVIARADKSGTTSMFTEALSSFSPQWNITYGAFSQGKDPVTEQSIKWKKNVIYLFGEKNRGVSGLILSIKYTIGYMSVSSAVEADITYARVQNSDGAFVDSSDVAIQGAMDRWSETMGDVLTGTLSDQSHPSAYPIAGFTYLILYKTTMTQCSSAKELVRYVNWFMTDPGAQENCRSVHMVPLSQSLVDRIREKVLMEVTCNGQNVWNMVQADIRQENYVEEPWIVPVAISVPMFLVVLGILLAYIIYQRWKLNKMIDSGDWDIPIEDIIFFLDGKVLSGGRSKLGTMKSIKSLQNIEDIPEGSELLDKILQWPGKWRGHVIGIRILEMKDVKVLHRDTKKLLLWMRDSVIHSNVVRFFGLTMVDNDHYVIGEYCSKGPMTDILQDEKYNLTNDFKFSLATDIASGVNFLHNQNLVHGSLKSSCCLIDSKWTVKIGDWEYCHLLQEIYKKKNPLWFMRKDKHNISKYAAAFRDFWVAPEIIRSDFEIYPSTSSDVYSFAIILQEIFTREDPYSEHADTLSPDDVLRAVVNNNLRPTTTDDTPLHVRQIMEIGWTDNAVNRPSFEQIVKMLRQSRSSRKSMLDSMMEAMEEYTVHLEERVEERTCELTMAKRNMERMMTDIFPRHMVHKVSNGQSVETKIYPSLGIVKAEIVNMKDFADKSSAKEIVQYLNDMHCEIENALMPRDTCRAHFQGESFTVVIGLQGETSHIEKCADITAHTALDIILHANKVTCPSSISKPFEFRVGAHIGSVASGIVGHGAPRFIVIGETMNIVQTLTNNSGPSRVLMSATLYKHIHDKGSFFVEPAQPIDHKHGSMGTYWLQGRDSVVVGVPSDMSVDSGLEVEKARADSLTSESSLKSQQSQESASTSNRDVIDRYPNTDNVKLSPWGLSPIVTVKAPSAKGKSSKNKVHPQEMFTGNECDIYPI